jgi:hypothetical protein
MCAPRKRGPPLATARSTTTFPAAAAPPPSQVAADEEHGICLGVGGFVNALLRHIARAVLVVLAVVVVWHAGDERTITAFPVRVTASRRQQNTHT